MKKTLKLLSAAFAAVMLLTAVAAPVAMAATTGSASSIIASADLYILEQMMKGNCIPLANGNYLIPSIGEVDGDEIRALYSQYWGSQSPSYSPIYPVYPNYPFYPSYPSNPSGIQVIEVEMNQYETKSLTLGASYTYTSLDPSVVTVDQSGFVYAVSEGTASISVSKDGFTWFLIQVTVNGIDFDPEVYSVDLVIGKTLLEVGDSLYVYTRLLKNGYYVALGQEYIVIHVEDTDVVTVENGVLEAVGVGITTVTAYIPNTSISEEVEIQVINKLDTPTYPTYPSYPNYPFYPSYPSYPSYPNYPFYPSFGNTWYPSYGTSLAEWLGIDEDVYNVTYKMIFLQGEWQQVLVATPKDGTTLSMSDYVIRYKLIYKNGDWTYIPYMVPKNMDTVKPETPETPEEEEKEDPTLTPEELEALKKAEEEAKKLVELKKLIAKAVKGELEWYEVYTDLNGDASYYNGVEFVLNNQYLTGKDNGKFGTKDTMTFADVKELMCKYTKLTNAEFDKTGILTLEDGEKEITRQEITLAFYNLAVYLKEDVSKKASFDRYYDVDQLDGEYSDAFGWAIRHHIIITTSKNMIPKGNVTRGDLARMLHRFDIFAN